MVHVCVYSLNGLRDVCFIGELKKEDGSGMLLGEHWHMWGEAVFTAKCYFLMFRY